MYARIVLIDVLDSRNKLVTCAAEVEPFNPGVKPAIMDRAQIITHVKATFEASHNQCSLDYLASRLVVTSEEVERVLMDLEREGRVRYDKAKGFWRWLN